VMPSKRSGYHAVIFIKLLGEESDVISCLQRAKT
jgi:hypothetical protein